MSDDGSGDDWENLLETGKLDQKLGDIKLNEVKESVSTTNSKKCVDPFDDCCVPGQSSDTSKMNLSDPTFSGPIKILSNDSRQLLRRPEPTMKILKRPEQNTTKVAEPQAPKTVPKSLSQREAEYAEARQRILGPEAQQVTTPQPGAQGSSAGKNSVSGNTTGKSGSQSGKQNNKQNSTGQGGKQGNRGGSNSNRKQNNNSQAHLQMNSAGASGQYFLPGMPGQYPVGTGHYPPNLGTYPLPPGGNGGGGGGGYIAANTVPYPPPVPGAQYQMNGGPHSFPGGHFPSGVGINYPPPPRPGQDATQPFFQVRR